jgi:hypothetical protein
MISCTSPPEQKFPPRPGNHDDLDVVGIDKVAEGVAQLRIGFQRQRVLALRTVERHRRHLPLAPPQKMPRLEIGKINPRRAEPVGRRSCHRRLLESILNHLVIPGRAEGAGPESILQGR